MRNVVQQSFIVFTIDEKSYTVVYQKYMKENVVSSEISIHNKAEMSFQMDDIGHTLEPRLNSVALLTNWLPVVGEKFQELIADFS